MASSDDAAGRPRGAVPLHGTRPSAAHEAAAYIAGSAVAEGSGLHRLLVESVRDYAIFALDPEGRIISWNAGAEHLKGFTTEDVLGRHYSMLYPPEAAAAGKPERHLVLAERDGRVEDEGWRVRKDGSRFWASVVITALRDEHGTLVGFAKVTRDLTERHRAEEALRERERRLRVLVQGVKDYAIFRLDPDGRVASWNEGARLIKGYAEDEIVGRHFSAFYPAEDVAAGKPARELEIAARNGTYEEEGWRVRKDGTRFWASVLITALYGDDGAPEGFAKVTRDLTERRAAQERALADARRTADSEGAARSRTEFLTALSHELRTPINATLGYAELLALGLRGPLTEAQREDLERIRRNQHELLAIINDLLNYSRVDAGQVTYDLSPVPLRTVVDAVLPVIAPQAAAKEIAVERGRCPEDIVARADRGKVEQILLNLLSNAVKFTPAGGRVTVACAAAEGRALLTVTDTGPGIPAAQHAVIFEPFVQIGRSLRSGHAGTGLGLAISRDLARAMGGDVTVESAPGQGAAFTLTLPAAS
jgi:PAS domain S-box-containing protein